MSNADALATVTATLRGMLLDRVAADVEVSTKPPSVARTGVNSPQINIFLYSTQHNSAFSNFPMPGEVRNGERAYPPLSLILKYLITVYGKDDDDISGQKLMGVVMSCLHDNPVLDRSDIEDTDSTSGLHRQIERVRITPDTLSLDDMSKLWSSFQSAEYRLSTGYQASVVLIESEHKTSVPLPILKRGEKDQGGTVTAAPLPVLTGYRSPNQKPSTEFGDVVTLLGKRLNVEGVIIRLQHPLLVDSADPSVPKFIELHPESGGTDSEITFKIPSVEDDPIIGSKWRAGFYGLSLVVKRTAMADLTSNTISMPLSPKIQIDPTTATAGDVELKIECLPQIHADQRAVLLFGDQMILFSGKIAIPANPSASSSLTFTVENVQARTVPYVVRLRIDEVDSIPVDFSKGLPQFDTKQMVVIT